MSTWQSLLVAALAYSLLSAGMVLEKKGVVWIGFRGPKNPAYFKNLFIWILGFLLVNLSIVPNTMALKTLSPHIVASVAGWGVAVMVILSRFLLGERLYAADFLDTALIVGAIVVLNLFEKRNADDVIRGSYLIAVAAAPFVILAFSFLKDVSHKTRAVLLAAVSGLCTGMITVSMKVLVLLFGFRVGAYFASPYLYLYLLFSIAAFVTLQLAFRAGAMMLAGPAQYSAAIIYPVIGSILVFISRLHPVQPAAILAIVALSGRILRRHWQPAAGGH